jgi:hypothetical protein
MFSCVSPQSLLLQSVSGLLASDIRRALGVHEQGYDQAIETQDFGEDEDQNHADEKSGLLGCAADTCVANDTDCEAGGLFGQLLFLVIG